VSVAGSQRSLSANARLGIGELLARVKQLLFDRSDHSIARRVAATAFLIRVFGAGVVFLSHILLANWMGSSEFGIYVYVWTWLVLVGGLAPLGIAYSAQRFIPEYTAGKNFDRLRGFLVGGRLLSFSLGLSAAIVGLAVLLALRNRISDHYELPGLLALACLPLYTLAAAQDGIARTYNWINVAIVPAFVAQPLIVLAIVVVDHLLDLPVTAVVAMVATVTAIWTSVLMQAVILQRRLSSQVAAGPRHYEFGRWFRTALPIFMVDGFYFLLTYIDILLLKFFVDPSQIGIYYAATKTLVLITFIYYAVSAAFAHRFSEAHYAGQRERLEFFIREATRWTFWPSLAAAFLLLALGKPILMLFGAEFTSGYPLLFVLVIGLLARASIGPGERLLIMVGEQRVCAAIYATAFATNFVLCLLLIPQFGLAGAAASTATALVVESTLLFVMAKRRLGLHVFFWNGRSGRSAEV
jgi:O-antigen/teichoic acid export membrane protein